MVFLLVCLGFLVLAESCCAALLLLDLGDLVRFTAASSCVEEESVAELRCPPSLASPRLGSLLKVLRIVWYPGSRCGCNRVSCGGSASPPLPEDDTLVEVSELRGGKRAATTAAGPPGSL